MTDNTAAEPVPDGRGSQRVWPLAIAVACMASLPYAALLATNVGERLDMAAVTRWWGLTLAAGLVPVAVATWFDRRWARWAGAMAVVALFLFFNYPMVTALREGIGVPVGDLAWWVGLSVVFLGLMVPAGHNPAMQRFLVIVAPALLLLPVVQFVTASEGPGPRDVDRGEPTAPFVHRPNVYWFILDGQAGPPFLRELGMDPDPFLKVLQDRGFDVQEQARANYPFTHVGVSSSLEMAYLYEGVEEPPAGPYFRRLQGDNRTVDTFLDNGYGYVHTYPGLWTGSQCGGREDLCLGARGPLTDTEFALLAVTPMVDLAVDSRTTASVATLNDPVHVVDVTQASGPDAPYFAFIHLLNPHPPYLRDADCGLREDVPLRLSLWGDGDGYTDAVTCLFRRLEVAVDRILAVDDDPVIILQGDHGPRLGLGPDTSGPVLLEDPMFFSTLSAIRLPDACAGLDIPDDMTTVNTFRVVFACLQDEPMDLLEDRIFPILREY